MYTSGAIWHNIFHETFAKKNKQTKLQQFPKKERMVPNTHEGALAFLLRVGAACHLLVGAEAYLLLNGRCTESEGEAN